MKSGLMAASKSDLKTVAFDATLKPCPFCGGSNLEVSNTHTASFWVACNDCDAQTHGEYFDGPQRNDKFHYENCPDGSSFEATYDDLHPEYQKAFRSAVKAWNTRVASESAAPNMVQDPYALRFPTMLRKMWSGSEVQKWLDGLPSLYVAPVNGREYSYLDVVFDGPPQPPFGRFVEVENPSGQSVNAGKWIERGGGLWALRIPRANGVPDEAVDAAIAVLPEVG